MEREKPLSSPKIKETSEERRKNDLSKYRAGNSSLIMQHNSCIQLQFMGDNGNYLSWNNDDSDDDLYDTLPETINTDSEPEYDDNPNAPENSGDEFENDSELEELMNNPSNETAMELKKIAELS